MAWHHCVAQQCMCHEAEPFSILWCILSLPIVLFLIERPIEDGVQDTIREAALGASQNFGW